MKKTILSLMVLAVSACGPLNQDPLRGKPDPVREGRPPNLKPEPPRPMQSDAVVLDAPLTVSFMEGRQDRIQLGSRVLVETHRPATIRILNQEAFPGAEFNEETFEFSWLPEKGTVFTGLSREMILQIGAESEAFDPERPALVTSREIRVTVHRQILMPEVRSVDTPSQVYREGGNFYLNVRVFDPDAGHGAGEEPKIVIQPPQDRSIKSLAPVTMVSSRNFSSSTGLWTFNLFIDLRDVEITRSMARAGFQVQAVSRFGQVSPVVKFDTRVFTKLGRLSTTWSREVTLVAGQRHRIPFLIQEERGEGRITPNFKSFEEWEGSVRQCGLPQAGWIQCEIDWTPPVELANRRLTGVVEAVARNFSADDTESVANSFNLNVRVVEPTPSEGEADPSVIEIPEFIPGGAR